MATSSPLVRRLWCRGLRRRLALWGRAALAGARHKILQQHFLWPFGPPPPPRATATTPRQDHHHQLRDQLHRQAEAQQVSLACVFVWPGRTEAAPPLASPPPTPSIHPVPCPVCVLFSVMIRHLILSPYDRPWFESKEPRSQSSQGCGVSMKHENTTRTSIHPPTSFLERAPPLTPLPPPPYTTRPVQASTTARQLLALATRTRKKVRACILSLLSFSFFSARKGKRKRYRRRGLYMMTITSLGHLRRQHARCL